MKIQWTFSAKKNLKRVFDFYKKTASDSVAKQIRDEILEKVGDLYLGDALGQEEEVLKHLEKGHRYLISRHCKIIYFVESEVAYITHVFDTRQDPDKLQP